MADVNKDDAKRFIETARNRASSVSNKVFLAAAAFLILWATSMERQRIVAQEVFVSQRSIAFQRLVNSSLTGTKPSPWKTKEAHSITDRQRKVWERRRAAFHSLIAGMEAKSARVQSEVAFDVFGLKFAAPAQLAALFWLILATGGLYYLLMQRRICLSLLARGVRCLKETDSSLTGLSVPLAPAMPCWLAPLPRRDGTFVSASEIGACLGWGERGIRWRTGIIAAMTAVVAIAVLRVSWIGIVTIGAMNSSWLVACGTIVLVGVVALLTSEWWTPCPVDDAYEEDSHTLCTRRYTLAVLAGAFTSIAISPLLLAAVLRMYRTPAPKVVRYPLGPKSKRNLQSVQLQPGFYVNPRSSVVYYVTESGTILSNEKRLAWRALRPVKVDRIGSRAVGDQTRTLWVNRGKASLSYETAALEAFARDAPDEACRILLVGIRQAVATRTDLDRLAELCATIALRKGLSLRFNELEILIGGAKHSQRTRIRLDTWRNQDSRWRKQRDQTKGKCLWAGLPM